MRKTKFSLIVTHQPSGYAYTCGFKNNADAELFVAEFGGVIEPIDCVFYDDIADAKKHREKLHNLTNAISEIDDELLANFIQTTPDLAEKLKRIIT